MVLIGSIPDLADVQGYNATGLKLLYRGTQGAYKTKIENCLYRYIFSFFQFIY